MLLFAPLRVCCSTLLYPGIFKFEYCRSAYGLPETPHTNAENKKQVKHKHSMQVTCNTCTHSLSKEQVNAVQQPLDC